MPYFERNLQTMEMKDDFSKAQSNVRSYCYNRNEWNYQINALKSEIAELKRYRNDNVRKAKELLRKEESLVGWIFGDCDFDFRAIAVVDSVDGDVVKMSGFKLDNGDWSKETWTVTISELAKGWCPLKQEDYRRVNYVYAGKNGENWKLKEEDCDTPMRIVAVDKEGTPYVEVIDAVKYTPQELSKKIMENFVNVGTCAIGYADDGIFEVRPCETE